MNRTQQRAQASERRRTLQLMKLARSRVKAPPHKRMERKFYIKEQPQKAPVGGEIRGVVFIAKSSPLKEAKEITRSYGNETYGTRTYGLEVFLEMLRKRYNMTSYVMID